MGGGIDQDGRAVGQVETGADDAADIRFFTALMGADDAGQGASVGDAEGGDAEDRGAGEQFLDMGGAAEEGEVRGGLEFGVHGRFLGIVPGFVFGGGSVLHEAAREG